MSIRKMRLLFHWRELRLPYKLLLVYIPLIMMPALAGIYIITESYIDSSNARLSEYATNTLSLMGEKIDDRLRSYEQLSKQIMTDDDLLESIALKPSSEYERLQIQSAINTMLNVLWLGTDRADYVRAIKIQTPYEQYTYGTNAINNFGVSDPGYTDEVALMEGGARWYKPENYSDGYNSFDAFRLGRLIRDKKLNELGTLTIIIDKSAVTDIFDQTKFQESIAFKLLSWDGALILSNGADLALGERQLLTYSQDRTHNGWHLSAQLPYSQLYEPIYRTVRLAVFIVLACILLGLIVTRQLAMDLVIPIRKLMLNMKQGIKGMRPDHLQHFGGAVEIVEMNDTFISIMYEIKLLIEAVAKQETKKKEAEIRVLQNQLSPHFLYNTLNSIRWMAMIQNQNNIKEMVDSLNQLLTYTLRGKGEPVQLSEEIAMLRYYVTIQKVRYQHIQFHAEVPSRLKNALVPKFLVQPLIENAFIHGLAQTDRPGEVGVHVREEGTLLQIVVTDNGVGIEMDRIAEIIGGFGQADNHFGLHSVHERIQLQYGFKYGLSIRSVPGHWTAITVTLPLQIQTDKEEDGYAQRTDRG